MRETGRTTQCKPDDFQCKLAKAFAGGRHNSSTVSVTASMAMEVPGGEWFDSR